MKVPRPSTLAASLPLLAARASVPSPTGRFRVVAAAGLGDKPHLRSVGEAPPHRGVVGTAPSPVEDGRDRDRATARRRRRLSLGPEVLFFEDFETQFVGEAPAGSDAVNPETPETNLEVVVVDETSNAAGTGNGLRLRDSDGSDGVRIGYDFASDPPFQRSAVGASLSFSSLESGSGSGDYLKVSFYERGASQSSSSRRFVDCRLQHDGTVDFRSGTGPDSSGHALDAGSNELVIYVNDYDSKSVNYTLPDGSTDLLPPNSVAYALNGHRIAFGDDDEYGHTTLEDRTTASGTVLTSEGNVGRFGINSQSSDYGLDFVIDDVEIFDLEATPHTPRGTSDLVQVDSATGNLQYGTYANEGQSNADNTVPDFSNVGYRGGGVPIPFVPTAYTVHPGTGNDRRAIQDGIDAVSAMPLGTDGFRGAVLIKAGTYDVPAPLAIATGGIVIRGEGSGASGGTRIAYGATAQSDMFEVQGSASPSEVGGTRRSVVDSYVPVGAKAFDVDDASGYAPGDEIVVLNKMNQQWLDDMSNMGQWGWTVNDYQLKHRRKVVSVSGNQITLDAPLVQAIEDQYGGGDVYKYQAPGALENVGFENLRLESAYASEVDENHGWSGIVFYGVKNGWIRQVTGLHFGFGLVSIEAWSSYITVEDSAMLDHKSEIAGGRRYSFNIDDSDYVLFQRLLTRRGRHDFVSGSKTPGPNVFVDCRAVFAYSDIGPHHRYATGQLYDNVQGDEINVQNRESSGSGHGWAGAQVMLWNVKGGGVVCDAPAGAMNWAVGVIGTKEDPDAEPYGLWESHNVPVGPRSLHQAQLADRVGPNALHGVVLPAQRTDDGMWNDLLDWGGDGLFLDAVVAWADEEAVGHVTNAPIGIGGAVRDLGILEGGFAIAWSAVSGPGGVAFADASSLDTTATFSAGGSYVLRLSVAHGSSVESTTLDVEVTQFQGAHCTSSSSCTNGGPCEIGTCLGDFTCRYDYVCTAEENCLNNVCVAPTTSPTAEPTSRPSSLPTDAPTNAPVPLEFFFFEDFEAEIVGEAPAEADEVRPSTPQANYEVVVVGPSVNTAGVGNGLRFRDSSTSQSLRIGYDFAEDDPPIQRSAVGVSLSFSFLGSNSGSGDYLKLALSEHGASLSSASMRFIDCRLQHDGTVDFRSGTGPDSLNHVLHPGSNDLSIYVNDYDAESVTYPLPNGSTDLLPPNSVAYVLNGERIAFGGQGNTALENRNTLAGSIFTSEGNVGRFGMASTTSDYGIDYVFDDIGVFELPVIVNFHDFESGWGIWNAGGDDVRRNSNDAAYCFSGSWCARIRDGSGEYSSMTTNSLDFSSFSKVKVKFSFQGNSMEEAHDEDFFLEYSGNDGAAGSWETMKRYVSGTDFINGSLYIDQEVVFTPTAGGGSASSKLRFRCDASSNGDMVYIDDVTIIGLG